MRNPNFMRFAMLIAALAIAACGPSSKELSGAKTAHYKGDKLEMFTKIKTTIESKYDLNSRRVIAARSLRLELRPSSISSNRGIASHPPGGSC